MPMLLPPPRRQPAAPAWRRPPLAPLRLPAHLRLPSLFRWLGLGALLGLTGCASLAPQASFEPVAQATRAHLDKALHWVRSADDQAANAPRVAALLARPLGADEAVQLALLNHRGLQARLQDLAIADADRVQASRLPNPGFSLGRVQRGDEREIERSLHLDLASLMALPRATRLAEQRLAETRARVTLEVLALAADTRRAHVHAVAAEQAVQHLLQVQQAADAGAELARRMEQAGNFTPLQRAREQAFAAEAALALAQGRQASRAARERLTRLLGLAEADTGFALVPRLPELPELAEPPGLAGLAGPASSAGQADPAGQAGQADQADQADPPALARRLDVQQARLAVEQAAQQRAMVQQSRWVNGLSLGLQHNSANDAPPQRGWELGLALPLFDDGQARLARAEALHLQAVHRAAEVATNARSELREAWAAVRTAHAIARLHRDELVPLQQRIAEENLLRYNGMLIGVFELLADARSQIATVQAAIGALRDFWLAKAELDQALVGAPRAAGGALPVAAGAAPRAAEGGH